MLQVMYFMQQGQLGAEGFLMGSLYSAVGLGFAALIWLTPYLKERTHQRIAGYVAIGAILTCLSHINGLYHWKTGHRYRVFLW